MRRLIVLAAAAVSALLLAACGLPTDEDFQSIDHSDDGFSLWQTSTTSTTLPPTTTIDATTTTTIAVTTTSIVLNELVDFYFPTGRDLAPIKLEMPIDANLTLVMNRLLKGPPECGCGLRSILPPDAAVTADKVDGVAVVDFPMGLFDEMAPRDQRLVFGQIVLTLSRQRGVGPIQFTQAGQPMQVFLGNGTPTSPGDLVSADDYTGLLSGANDPIETTTTTTVPPPPTVDPTAVATTTEG